MDTLSKFDSYRRWSIQTPNYHIITDSKLVWVNNGQGEQLGQFAAEGDVGPKHWNKFVSDMWKKHQIRVPIDMMKFPTQGP